MSDKRGDVVFYQCTVTGRKRSQQYLDSLPHDHRCPHTAALMRPVFCPLCTESEIESRYVAINNAYRAGNNLMEDKDWDRFEMHCRNRYPDCNTFHKVGTIE